MNLLITLTTAGLNSGPFNLYSDTDYYYAAFETDVPKQDLLDGYVSTLVPDGTTIIRVISDNPLCTNYADLSIAVPTTTTTTTIAATYCTSWTAANEGNIKMSTQGYIDFSAILAGRTIESGPLSVGTIIGYIVAGVGTFTCSIPMTFTTSQAQWNTDLLPVVTDKVLTSLVYNVEVVFNNSDEYLIVAGQTNAVVIPEQLTSEYNDCPVPTTTTTSSSSTSTSTSTSTTTSTSSTITTTTTACVNCEPNDVTIGSQIWTGCNLNVDTYSDGTVIPQVTDPTQWQNLTTGAWCYYVNNSSNGPIYGKLYNFYAVAGIDGSGTPRSLAPVGYHVPSKSEFDTLVTYLGGESLAGGKMKEPNLCHWSTPNSLLTPYSGFAALPGGYRNNVAGTFQTLGTSASLWSSSESSTNPTQNGLSIILSYNDTTVFNTQDTKQRGFSVRLIKD